MNSKAKAITVLILMMILIGCSLFALPRLHTQYSLKQFLPTESQILEAEEKSRLTFYISDIQPFIVTATLPNHHDSILSNSSSELEGWLTKEHINDLSRLTKQLEKIEGVTGALSFTTLQGVENKNSTLSLGPLVDKFLFQKDEKLILNNPLLSPTLISSDGKIASIIVQIRSTNTSDLKFIRGELENQSKKALPYAQINLGGAPAIQADINVLLESEIRLFILLAIIACFVTTIFVFKNLSPLVITFVIVISTNILVLAIMALAGYSLSILSSTIPILTTVDVMSLCIHTLLRFTEEKKNHPLSTHEDLVWKTLKVIFKPNLIASTTTMIGFITLLSTKVPIMREYGWTAAISIIIGWIVTTILLMPLMLLLPEAKARSWAWQKARWGLHFFKYSNLWASLIILISLSFGIKGMNLSWSARLFDDLPSKNQSRISTQLIDEKLGGVVPIDLTLQGEEGFWNDPNQLDKLELLMKDLRQTPKIASILGLPELVSSIEHHENKVMNSDSKVISKNILAEIYFLYSLSNENPLTHFLNAESSTTRLAIRTRDLPGNEIHQLSETIYLKAKNIFPNLEIKVSGMGPTVHHLNNDLSKELIYGFWQSLMAIALMLVFVFKSIRWALIACIPNLVPPAILMGFLALSETPIKPSVAIIFSISLGLAFNNTVYLLERLRKIQNKNPYRKVPIQKALWLEGNPCLISSLILLTGFSVFMASHFSMNRVFGSYMLLSMLAGLVGDLILLPTLIKALPWLIQPLKQTKETSMSLSPSHIAAFFLILLPSFTRAEPLPSKVDQIAQEMNNRFITQDEEMLIQMKIIEADGGSKIREMQTWRMSPAPKDHYFLARMQKPRDLRGTALLATLKDSQEDKWIYLPSSKQTRRLTGESSQGGILGSEISVEDFDFNHDRSAQSTYKKEININNQKYYVIEFNVNSTSATYSKIISTISANEYLPRRAECFDKNGQLLKIIEFGNYKKISSAKWRPGSIIVENLKNKRKTEVILSQIKLNQNFKVSKFSAKALSND